LSGQVDALRLHPSKDAKASSPGAPAALILVGLAALAAVVRRSK
jgi:MYXO-CTERM domain-containing protein